MDKKNKLKELLKRLNSLEGSLPIGDTKSFLDGMLKDETDKFVASFKDNPTVKYLDGFNAKLEKFKRDFNLEPIISAVEKLQSDMSVSQETSAQEFGKVSEDYTTKYTELTNLIKSTRRDVENLTSKEVGGLLARIDQLQSELSYQSNDSNQKGQSLNSVVSELEKRINEAFKELKTQVIDRGDLSKSIETRFKESGGLITKTASSIDELRREMLTMFANRGGGSMNQQINVNSSVMSTRYADFNFKSSGGILWSSSNDDTNKRVNIVASVISAGAGGGGFTELAATGAVDSSNATFTFTQKPTYIVSDGVWYKENKGWTWSVSTATMTIPPNDLIFGVA